ncbi:MAG: hypothetical protein ABIJ52_04735 [Pseudomonadota bacterium]
MNQELFPTYKPLFPFQTIPTTSVIAKRIGNSEEIISLNENSLIDELLKIITKKYKKNLKDFISPRNGDYVFSRFVMMGVQRGGEGKVCMIDYMNGVETILNNGDVVFIYYPMAGG